MTEATKIYLKYILRMQFDHVDWRGEHIYKEGYKLIMSAYELGFTSLALEMLDDAKFEGFEYSI